MPYKDKRRKAFSDHKRRAGCYGIEFVLTFEKWWQIWESSGRWGERGNRRAQYCMARFNDKGPYAAGNVEIITNQENLNQPQAREKLASALYARNRSPEHGRTMSRLKRGNRNVRGRVWINNGNISKRVLPFSTIPIGWVRGRVRSTVADV
jgi:hypothetical protein